MKGVSVLPSIRISSVPKTASLHKAAGTSDRARGISGHLPDTRGARYRVPPPPESHLANSKSPFNSRSSFFFLF